MKLKENGSRSSLIEGRSYGLGLALCLRTIEGFETVNAISTCKDYLSDQVYTERVNKPCLFYGYRAQFKGCFKNGEAILAAKVVGYKNGSTYSNFEKDKQTLLDNHKAAEAFINLIESMLLLNNKLKIEKTTINPIGDDVFIIIGDEFWGRETYLMSLYSLLIRASIMAKWNGTQDPFGFLKAVKNDDSYMCQAAAPRLQRIISHGAPKLDMSSIDFNAHSAGIYGTDVISLSNQEHATAAVAV